MEYNSLLILITVIFSAVMLFIGIAAIVKKRYTLLPEHIATYIFYLAFLISQYMLNFQVNLLIILMVLITLIGNSLIGKYLYVYNTSKHYDRFLHAFGAFSFALFYYSILHKLAMPIVSSKLYIGVFVAAIGISLGCIFEIYEFISDSITTSNNQHGLKDTNFDMISNIIGSSIAGIVSIWIFL